MSCLFVNGLNNLKCILIKRNKISATAWTAHLNTMKVQPVTKEAVWKASKQLVDLTYFMIDIFIFIS